MESVDILIIGGGVAGLATAWQLGLLGRQRVLLLEREEQLGSHSSALNAAILRTCIADPLLAELAQRGAALLREPPRELCEHSLVEECGLILIDTPEGGELAAQGELAGGQELSGARLRELAPHFEGRVERAVYFPGGGHIDIAGLMEGLAKGARRGGVTLRTRVTVRELWCEKGRVRGVRLDDGGAIEARQVVIAAGGWAGRMGRSVGSTVELAPTRRHLLVTEIDPDVDPAWPILWRLDEGFYCRPESGGMLLCACDQEVVDPDRCVPDPAVLQPLAEKTARNMPRFAEAGARHLWCAMRTLCADGRFAVGPDPQVEGLFWAAGLGGHGMVCGVEVGRIAAMRLCGEEEADPFEQALDPARLAATRV